MAKKIQWNVSTKGIWKGKDIPEEAKDKLLQLDEFKGMEELPSDLVYFEGVVSNGDENRNGYKIESNAWFFENGTYVKDFLNTGSVFYNHDDNQPVGRPLAFELDKNGDDVNVSGYAWDDLMENRFGRKLILGLSTGHITHESVYEHRKTKARIDGVDFWKTFWSDENGERRREYWNDLWLWIVTKAEIVEFSPAPARSNRKAVMTNGIGPDQENFGLNIPKNTTKEQAKILFNNQFAMKYKKNADGTYELDGAGNKIPEENQDDVQTPATPETPATPVDENKLFINGVEVTKEEVEKLNNFIKSQVESQVKNHLESMENKMKEMGEKLENSSKEIETLRNTQKEKLGAMIPNGGKNKSGDGEKPQSAMDILKNKEA